MPKTSTDNDKQQVNKAVARMMLNLAMHFDNTTQDQTQIANQRLNMGEMRSRR
jgi:hypothetical protein